MDNELLTVSTTDKEFKEIITEALDKHKELLVLYRLEGAAGERHWYLIHTFAELEEIVNTAKIKDAFSVFEDSLLSVRGEANAEQKAKAMALLHKYGEIALGVSNPDRNELGDAWGTDEKEEIEDWFKDHWGEPVLAGRWPDFELEIVGAYVPDKDGVKRPGAY